MKIRQNVTLAIKYSLLKIDTDVILSSVIRLLWRKRNCLACVRFAVFAIRIYNNMNNETIATKY